MKKNRHEQLFKYPEIEFIKTKSLNYLLPVIGMSVDGLSRTVNNKQLKSIDILRFLGFKGLFIEWKQCPDRWDNECYLLFNPKLDIVFSVFSDFYTYLSSISNFLKLYHVNTNIMIVAMRLDSKWQHIKPILYTSKYSALGKEYANMFFNNNGILKREYHIVCRTDEMRSKMEEHLGLNEGELKGKELDSLFIREEEILDLGKLNIKQIEI